MNMYMWQKKNMAHSFCAQESAIIKTKNGILYI